MSILNRLFKRKSKRNDEEEFLDEDEDVEINNHQNIDNEFMDEEEAMWETGNDDMWDDGIENFHEEPEEEVYVDEDGNIIPPDQLHLYDLGGEEDTFEDDTFNQDENLYDDELGSDFPSFDDEEEEEEEESTEEPNYFSMPEEDEEPTLFGKDNFNSEPISFNSDIPTEGDTSGYNEEVEPNQEKVDINYGNSGLLDATKQSKENIYKEMVYKVTDRDIELISKAIQEQDSLWKIFSYLEENNVPLQYGVALEIFTEEEITGYRAYQQRDLIDSETKPIDDVHDTKYIEEIMRKRDIHLVEPLPKDVPVDKDTNSEEDSTEQDDKAKSTEEVSEKRTSLDIDAVIAQIKKRKDRTTEKNTQEEQVSEEVSEEVSGEVAMEETETELTEEIEEQENSEPMEEIPETDTTSEEVSPIEVVLPEKAPRNKKVDKILSKGVTNRIKGQKYKKVLVVCEGIQLPEFLGNYELSEVKSIADLRVVELSLDNVLVVTKLIPDSYRNGLIKWLNRVNKEDVRVVTLKGYEVKSSVIDRAISLTEDDLDTYFLDINKKTDMTEMGNHRDISRFLGRK